MLRAPEHSFLGASGAKDELSPGVMTLGARSYVPQIGRFLQTDPVEGGSANAYAYTFGDPVDSSDPSGALTWGWSAGGIAGADASSQRIVSEYAEQGAATGEAGAAEAYAVGGEEGGGDIELEGQFAVSHAVAAGFHKVADVNDQCKFHSTGWWVHEAWLFHTEVSCGHFVGLVLFSFEIGGVEYPGERDEFTRTDHTEHYVTDVLAPEIRNDVYLKTTVEDVFGPINPQVKRFKFHTAR